MGRARQAAEAAARLKSDGGGGGGGLFSRLFNSNGGGSSQPPSPETWAERDAWAERSPPLPLTDTARQPQLQPSGGTADARPASTG